MDNEYLRRCEQAKQTKIGDVWKHRKTGKCAEVIGRVGYYFVKVRHESGRVTEKQEHYLAGDYEMLSSFANA